MLSITNLGDGTTFLRNIVVTRIARKMKIMEKIDTGIRVILDSCKDAGDFRKIVKTCIAFANEKLQTG